MYLVNLNLDKSDISPYLSTTLLSGIEKNLKSGKKTILYMNKRGAFNSMICSDCSYLFECHQCDSSMNVHHNPNMLNCHLCGHKESIPTSCTSCGKSNLKSVGVGTQQIEEALERYFKNYTFSHKTPPIPLSGTFPPGEKEAGREKLETSSFVQSVPDYVVELARDMRKNGTQAEKILWNIVKGKQIEGLKFRRQHPFGRYIADFYCDELKIVIELDGKIHELQKQYDEIRDEIISKHGVKIIRIKNEDVLNNIDGVIQTILSPLGESTRRGIGGQTMEETKRGIKIFRFDSDSMKNKTDKASAIQQIESADIIIGTKMITTGFDFHDIGLIGVVLIESELKIPKYNTHEKVYNNITQLLGRGSRVGTKTDYIIQTFIPNNKLIGHITGDNYKDYFLYTLEERKLFGYPPFKQFATIEYRHANKQKSIDFITKIYKKLSENTDTQSEIIQNPNTFKKHNQYFSNIIIKSPDIRTKLQTIKSDIFSNSGLTIHFE